MWMASPLHAQTILNQRASRVVGQPRADITSNAANLIEGREFNNPQGIAIDTTVNPPVLYVSDTGNNRILAWKNASSFTNGAKADFVIGQNDLQSNSRGGPGTALSTGLSVPSGLITDGSGNLYVLDAGNNRILRFPKPYAQTEQLPNLVIGQTNFNSNAANAGGISEKTIATNIGGVAFGSAFAFDRDGNLWFLDYGNFRVLRYSASALGSDASNGPAAEMVLGQVDFSSITGRLQAISQNRSNKSGFSTPTGLALDPSGRLFVSDAALSRVLVYTPPFQTGKDAARIMGILPPNTPAPCTGGVAAGDILTLGPEGIFMMGGQPGIVDVSNNRILLFDAFDQWPAGDVSPRARSVGPVGQVDFCGNKGNRGQPTAGPNTLFGPSHAAVTASELFVIDSFNHRVLVFPLTGLGQTATATRLLGQDAFHLNSPNLVEGREFDFVRATTQGVAVDAGLVMDLKSDPPHLYVADTFNNRVLGFRDARRIRPGDTADLVIGQPDMQQTLINYPANDVDRPTARSLFQPTGVVLDSDGNLYVADNGNSRVLRFKAPFDQPELNYPAADLVLGQGNFTTKITDATPTRMRAPYGLAFAGDNGLLVSDIAHHRVLLFRGKPADLTSGQAAFKVFGQPDFTTITAGNADNKMNGPHHISTDTDDRLYVADTGNNRILIFNRAPVAETNPRAATILGAGAPRGVFVSQVSGEIWVSESNANRLLRFPRFDDLAIQNNQANFALGLNGGVFAPAIAQDSFGDVLIADNANRVAIYYPTLAGVFNAANLMRSRALAPGTIATVYPQQNRQFADDAETASTATWPKEMRDLQVLVNESPAPLYYVGVGLISFQVPYGTPANGQVELQVVRKSTGQILAAGQMDMDIASPGFFTTGGNGVGQLAALNEDGTLNTPANPAARGTVLTIFGTGFGNFAGLPADGEPATGALETPDKPRVIFALPPNTPDPEVLYSGVAPFNVGMWQINFRIPMAVAPASAVRIAIIYKSIASADAQRNVITTIAVKQ